jgi:hypothetical protein
MIRRQEDLTARQWWDGLGRARQGGVVALGVAEVVVTSVALVDLARRPGALVRGPKIFWVLACFVQPVGPVAYLLLGRATANGVS